MPPSLGSAGQLEQRPEIPVQNGVCGDGSFGVRVIWGKGAYFESQTAKGRRQQLSWVVPQVGAEPGVLGEFCLQSPGTAGGDLWIALASLCKKDPQILDIKRIVLKTVESSLQRVDLLPGPLRSRSML